MVMTRINVRVNRDLSKFEPFFQHQQKRKLLIAIDNK